jgi:hypothetical protein
MRRVRRSGDGGSGCTEIKALRLSRKGLPSLSVWRFCPRTARPVVSSRRLVLTPGDLRSTAPGALTGDVRYFRQPIPYGHGSVWSWLSK